MTENIVKFYENNVENVWHDLIEYFQWILVNLQIQFIKKNIVNVVFKKEIFMVNFWVNVGSEYRGIRPAIVISGGSINKWSMVLIVPCSSYRGNLFKYDILLDDYIVYWFKSKTVIKVSHLSSISKKRLIKKIWSLDQTRFNNIIRQINFCLKEKTSPRKPS